VATLEQSSLGKSSIGVSRIGLGCNNFGRKLDVVEARRVVDAALDAGINFFDTADVYGGGQRSIPAVREATFGDSERFLGEALSGRRDRIVVATKFGNPMEDRTVARGAPAYVRSAVDASLGRLGVEHIDVLYYHRPDGVTPLAETIGAMEDLVRAGKVRAIGCSNLTSAQLAEVGDRIAVLENELNLLERSDEAEVLPLCLKLGVGYVPYFPLAGGKLSGKYRRDQSAPAGARLEQQPLSENEYDRIEALEEFAEAEGHNLLELAIAWLASHPAIPSVIAGATSAEQVQANAAAGGWQLTPEQFDAVSRL
jgi:aryl-alcohol dehydrogenase-like predicted oxidoreductase